MHYKDTLEPLEKFSQRLHVSFPLSCWWDGDLVLLSDIRWRRALNIVSATRVDSVALVSLCARFAIEDVAKMTPTIGTCGFCHTFVAAQ